MVTPINIGARGTSGPPDLTELLEKIFAGRGRGGGGGAGSSGGRGGKGKFGFIAILLVLVLGWAAFTSFYTVQPEQRAVIKRFGAVVGITDPGLHFKLPFGVDQVRRVATERVLKQEFGFRTRGTRESGPSAYSSENLQAESLMLTGDLNMINVEWVVQYRIQDPIKFLYQLREPTRTLRDISESVMRRIVGNMLGSEVLTVGRVEIQRQATLEIQEILDSYDAGIHISTVEMQDVVPPP